MSAQRLGIGIVVTNLPSDVLGGAQKQAVRMAQELAKNHDVTIFARGGAGSTDGLDLDGVRVSLRKPFPIPWVRLLVDARAAARQVLRHDRAIDVLVCHQTLGAGLVGAMARAHGIPFLVHVHGRHEYRTDRLNQFRLFSPRVYQAADRVVVLDAALKKEILAAYEHRRFRKLRQRLQERVRVIPNGIDARPMRSGTGRYIIYVGRLIRSKGIADLVSAMRVVPGVELVVVGDGPERGRLQKQAEGCSVSWTGRLPQEEVLKRIKDAMCLVLPSYSEVFPMVILEAMSVGVPVVATPVGGVPTLVKHGENGMLVPPGDPEALGRAIGAIAESEAMRESMGSSGHERVARFVWPVVGKMLLDEIREVV